MFPTHVTCLTALAGEAKNRVSDVILVVQSDIHRQVKCRQASNNNAMALRIARLARIDRTHMQPKILELNREFNKLGTW